MNLLPNINIFYYNSFQKKKKLNIYLLFKSMKSNSFFPILIKMKTKNQQNEQSVNMLAILKLWIYVLLYLVSTLTHNPFDLNVQFNLAQSVICSNHYKRYEQKDLDLLIFLLLIFP